MAGNLSDCVPSIINGKLIWYAWKNSHNTFYEINLSDLSSNHATRIENGHKYVYGTTIENNQIDKTCRVCGITSKAAVPTKISAYITPSNSSYHTLNGSEFLTKDLTYTVDWSTWFSGNSSDDYLSDCTISCSDNSILTVQQTSDSVAVITPKKSGKAILTIQSKYNPSVVFTSELYVDMLSEDVFTFSHGYIGYYDGTKKDPDVKIYRSGLTLTEGTDYTATYKGDQVNAGTFTVTFTGIGKYTGSVTKKYTIQPARIYSSSTTCTISPENCIYDGKPQEPNVVITDHGKALTRGKDYTVEYQNNTSIGRARAGITGIGNYSGYFTTAFYISWGSISNCDITLSDTSLTYDGTEKKPPVTVKCNGNTLTEDQDYYLYYRNNTNVGTASVTISGAGNFSGSETKTFQIKASDFSKCDIQLSASSFTYDGTEKKPKITVKSGRKLLVSGTDYTVSCRNNINVGTASVTITGKGSYSGSQTKNFTITPADLTKTKISLSASSFIYDGAEKKPAITIKAGKKQLTLNKDYTISYKNNTNVGTASVTVTGKGNYTGTISKSFTIAATNLSTADVKLSAASFTYNGKAITPSVTVTCNGKVLTNGTDYSVAYTNNINAGTARVTITGTGAYSGVKTVTFRIKRAKATLTPTAAALTLTQSSRKTAVIKRKKTDGKISLKSSNSKIVKISGTSIIPLSPGKATVTITAAQGKNYNAVSARISISVRPLPVSSLSLKSSAKGQATVSWKQVKSITSYQIQYSTASSMKSARTITVKGASKSAVLKKLTRGKKYYVRIRTVKTVSKKNYYSTWSKTTSVKVK